MTVKTVELSQLLTRTPVNGVIDCLAAQPEALEGIVMVPLSPTEHR